MHAKHGERKRTDECTEWGRSVSSRMITREKACESAMDRGALTRERKSDGEGEREGEREGRDGWRVGRRE